MLVDNTTDSTYVLSGGVILHPNETGVVVADSLYQTYSGLNDQIDAMEVAGLIVCTDKPADPFPSGVPAAWFQNSGGIVWDRSGATELVFEAVYDNPDAGNELAFVPTNLGLTWDPDDDGSQLTTTEDGVWQASVALTVVTDATAAGSVSTNLGTWKTAFVPADLARGYVLHNQTLIIPKDVSFLFRINRATNPTANPYSINGADLLITRVA